jgi:hypothetical protein
MRMASTDACMFFYRGEPSQFAPSIDQACQWCMEMRVASDLLQYSVQRERTRETVNRRVDGTIPALCHFARTATPFPIYNYAKGWLIKFTTAPNKQT